LQASLGTLFISPEDAVAKKAQLAREMKQIWLSMADTSTNVQGSSECKKSKAQNWFTRSSLVNSIPWKVRHKRLRKQKLCQIAWLNMLASTGPRRVNT